MSKVTTVILFTFFASATGAGEVPVVLSDAEKALVQEAQAAYLNKVVGIHRQHVADLTQKSGLVGSSERRKLLREIRTYQTREIYAPDDKLFTFIHQTQTYASGKTTPTLFWNRAKEGDLVALFQGKKYRHGEMLKTDSSGLTFRPRIYHDLRSDGKLSRLDPTWTIRVINRFPKYSALPVMLEGVYFVASVDTKYTMSRKITLVYVDPKAVEIAVKAELRDNLD